MHSDTGHPCTENVILMQLKFPNRISVYPSINLVLFILSLVKTQNEITMNNMKSVFTNVALGCSMYLNKL